MVTGISDVRQQDRSPAPKRWARWGPAPKYRLAPDGVHENHPELLESEMMFNQKLIYLHWNPVTAGFVVEPWHWKYSSAVDYMTNEKGLLNLIMLD